MNIYGINYPYDAESDDFIYKGIYVDPSFDLFTYLETVPPEHATIPLAWFPNEEHKIKTDAVLNANGFLIISEQLVNQILPFVPDAICYKTSMEDSVKSDYVLLRIKRYEDSESGMSQIFRHGAFYSLNYIWCCTEKFKKFWESQNLTGLDFKLIGIVDDHLFLPIGEKTNDQVC